MYILPPTELAQGMSTVAARGSRRAKREAMVVNLTSAADATDRPGDVVAQALMDMENSLGAGVIADMFVLGVVDDSGDSACQTAFSAGVRGPGQRFRKREWQRCARDTGLPLTREEVENAKSNTGSVNSGGRGMRDIERLAPMAAKLCRHSIALQNYRGEQTAFGLWWDRVHQTTGVPLASIEPLMDPMEIDAAGPSDPDKPGFRTVGAKLTRDVSGLMRRGAMASGVLVVPVFAREEVLMGMVVVRNADKVPHATYTVAKRGEGVPKEAGDDGDDGATSQFVDIEAPEDGVIQGMTQACALVGAGLLSARLGTVAKKLKSFPISTAVRPPHFVNPDGSAIPLALLALRTIFRGVAEALPAVLELTVWGVDLDRKVRIVRTHRGECELGYARTHPPLTHTLSHTLSHTSHTPSYATVETKKPGFLSRMFGFGGGGGARGDDGHDGAAADAAEKKRKKQQNEGLLEPPSATLAKNAILTAMFDGSPDPTGLLLLAEEKKAPTGIEVLRATCSQPTNAH